MEILIILAVLLGTVGAVIAGVALLEVVALKERLETELKGLRRSQTGYPVCDHNLNEEPDDER